MEKVSTKEIILEKSLEMFAVDGFEAVSVSRIAEAVGIKTPSLYAHFKSKQDIFDSILIKVKEIEKARVIDLRLPYGDITGSAESLRSSDIDALVDYCKEMFDNWTVDTFSSNFRRLLSLEQYRNPEMARLYRQYFVTGPIRYMTEIFRRILPQALDHELLALEFCGPLFLLYAIFDAEGDHDKVEKMLGLHVRHFTEQLKNMDLKRGNDNE